MSHNQNQVIHRATDVTTDNKDSTTKSFVPWGGKPLRASNYRGPNLVLQVVTVE